MRDETIRLFDGQLCSIESCVLSFFQIKQLPGDQLNVPESESLGGSVSLFPEPCSKHSFSSFLAKPSLP